MVIALPVEGHGAAVVSVPPGGTSRRPVLVATHGAGGTPEAECSFWREAVGEVAFVLCPRGSIMDVYAPPEERGYYYPAHPALGREVLDALAALVARFPDRVDRQGAVYAGFSQGATMGALFFSRAPPPFARLVLVEGGAAEWTAGNARAFKQGGGARVLFACGRRACTDAARRSATYLEQQGVESRVVDAARAGHTLGGAVGKGIVEALPWLLDGDARWRTGANP